MDRGWKRAFDDPIPLPRGRRLITLEDAGRYITKLAGTAQFFELTKLWSRREIIAWAKPNDRHALVAGRISF